MKKVFNILLFVLAANINAMDDDKNRELTKYKNNISGEFVEEEKSNILNSNQPLNDEQPLAPKESNKFIDKLKKTTYNGSILAARGLIKIGQFASYLNSGKWWRAIDTGIQNLSEQPLKK